MTINFDAPLNPTSIGQTSFNIYKELANDNEIHLFPYGDKIELDCFSVDENTKKTIEKNLIFSQTRFLRDDPSLTIWHIRGSERAMGNVPNLMTWHETDRLTPYEINRLNNINKVFVTSRFTKEIFDSYLLDPSKVCYAPLGFDSESFFKIPKDPNDEIITFGLRGKMERRKHTLKIMSVWAKVFGGDPRYRLDCSIHNMFQGNEQMAEIHAAMPDQTLPWNINLLPFLPTNELYNRALNNADIDLTGMSGCEGFNLPLFQSLCLGKQAIVLNAHVHKDFCNDANSILVEPTGMIDAEDGRFFAKGQLVNQGRWFDFNDSDLAEAMKVAASRGRVNNDEGEKLKQWTFKETARIIKENI